MTQKAFEIPKPSCGVTVGSDGETIRIPAHWLQKIGAGRNDLVWVSEEDGALVLRKDPHYASIRERVQMEWHRVTPKSNVAKIPDDE